MKLTKFIHACVLVEDDKYSALFDPGEFSFDSFPLDSLLKLDYVLITHEHPDHFSERFIKAIYSKFPDVQFFSTGEVVKKLQALGINKVSIDSDEIVSLSPLEHASMAPLSPLPMCQNVAIHFNNKVSHPGDSHHLTESRDILLMPLAGPWGAAIEGIRMAMKLKPKVVVPIHDWMWNNTWRQNMYDRLETFFQKEGVLFLKTTDGQTYEV